MLSKFYIVGIFVTLNTRVSLRRDLRSDGSEDKRQAVSPFIPLQEKNSTTDRFHRGRTPLRSAATACTRPL